ncbi:MAG: D-tagatose 3-epimerase [Phycisphaeraceae bacterium]|nr:D-tagatose 3-epimerase [Phycisphaeraceae bacterium]
MKFAICNETYQGWTFSEICEDVAACGYDGVEMAPFTIDEDPTQITEQQATEIGRTAKAAGLEITGMHWLLLKPPGMHLTTPDDDVREKTGDFVRHLVRLCAAMGGKILVWGSPRQRDIMEGTTKREAFDRAAAVIRGVCEEAGTLGVTLALEPLGPAETNFMVFAKDTVELVRAVDHPACRLHLDVKAMSQESDPVPQIIRDHRADMVYFHANDSNRRGPGFGETDFVPIGAALKDAGYDGWVSVEVFDYRPDPHTIAVKSLEYLKKTFAEAGAI